MVEKSAAGYTEQNTIDWTTDNLILLPDGQMGIIDCGIPVKDLWFEFWSIVSESKHFCIGQVKGYFNDKPPIEYFPLLAYIVNIASILEIYFSEYNRQCPTAFR